jgi:hypothetical protein
VRLAFIIVCLAAIGVGLVQIRRSELNLRHEIQLLQLQQVSLRRTLWDQEVRLGERTALGEVRLKTQAWGLESREDRVRTALGYGSDGHEPVARAASTHR